MPRASIQPLSLWIIAMAIIHPCAAQNPFTSFSQSLSIGASLNYGFTNPANIKLESIQDSRSFLGEIFISSQTTGQKNWQQSSNYPSIGLDFLFGQSGSRQYIGNLAAVFPFVNGLLIRKDNFRLGWRFGIGPGWVQKPFNAQTNDQNLIIGSHLNACINLQLTSSIKILPKIFLNLGLSFTHFSNGSIQLPNLGLNLPALSAGFHYSFNPRPKFTTSTWLPLQKKWEFVLFTFAAVKEAPPIESPKGLVNGLSFEAIRIISRSGRWGIGINFTYDQTLRTEITNSLTFAFDQSKLKLEASMYTTYEYVLGNLSIPIQIGAYLYNNYLISEIYEDLGLRWRFSRHWMAGMGLKAHVVKADFIHWGVGYQF